MYNNCFLLICFKRVKGMKFIRIGFKIVMMVCVVVIVISVVMGVIISYKVESVL